MRQDRVAPPPSRPEGPAGPIDLPRGSVGREAITEGGECGVRHRLAGLRIPEQPLDLGRPDGRVVAEDTGARREEQPVVGFVRGDDRDAAVEIGEHLAKRLAAAEGVFGADRRQAHCHVVQCAKEPVVGHHRQPLRRDAHPGEGREDPRVVLGTPAKEPQPNARPPQGKAAHDVDNKARSFT
jgi:hypothetical protein